MRHLIPNRGVQFLVAPRIRFGMILVLQALQGSCGWKPSQGKPRAILSWPFGQLVPIVFVLDLFPAAPGIVRPQKVHPPLNFFPFPSDSLALTNLIQAIREHRKLSDQPLTLRGSEYAHAVQKLNKAIDRAEDLLQI
jgi:hypothetical protein